MLLISGFIGCKSPDFSFSRTEIDVVLNNWHQDVAQYDFDAYFNALSEDAVFVGTDAEEVWSKKEFMEFSKPYFDKEQTWDFKPLDRHIYFDKKTSLVWFDETLNTWMGVCRGSGVLMHTNEGWKIKHYVLSVAVPNEDIKAVIQAKKERDSLYIIHFKK